MKWCEACMVDGPDLALCEKCHKRLCKECTPAHLCKKKLKEAKKGDFFQEAWNSLILKYGYKPKATMKQVRGEFYHKHKKWPKPPLLNTFPEGAFEWGCKVGDVFDLSVSQRF